jgi:hypothetical protein
MVNSGYTGPLDSYLAGTSAAPIAINYLTRYIPEVVVNKHTIPKEQTAFKA